MPRSSKCYLSIRSPHQTPICTSPVHHTCHMPRPSHSSWFDHPNNIWWEVQIIKLRVIFLCTLFLNTLNLRSSLSVTDRVPHPIQNNRQNKSSVHLNLYNVDSKLEDKRFCTAWLQAFPDTNLLLISPWMQFRISDSRYYITVIVGSAFTQILNSWYVVRYRGQKNAPLNPHLSQMNPPQTRIPYLKVVLILFSHLRPGLQNGTFPSGTCNKILYTFLMFSVTATYPALLLDSLTLKWNSSYRPIFSLRFIHGP